MLAEKTRKEKAISEIKIAKAVINAAKSDTIKAKQAIKAAENEAKIEKAKILKAVSEKAAAEKAAAAKKAAAKKAAAAKAAAEKTEQQAELE